ncbi:MAG: response regulator [Nitrospinae bacterium]|nr:response regulator [Nitrospinota bacterium]
MINNGKPFHILIADDEEGIRKTLQTALSAKGYEVTTVGNGLSALKVISSSPVDVVITDLKMPGMDGFELLLRIKGISSDLPVVVITGFADVESTTKALKAGASDFLTKPFGAKDIYHTVSRLLEIQQTYKDNQKVLPFMKFSLEYELPSNFDYINGAIHYIMEPVRLVGMCEPIQFTNMNIAIYEAIINAMNHGNHRDEKKTVKVGVNISFDKAVFTVSDQGEGFAPADVSNPTAPENLYKSSGRGIYLIKHFMDEVSFNQSGNQITMIKNRKKSPADDRGYKLQ